MRTRGPRKALILLGHIAVRASRHGGMCALAKDIFAGCQSNLCRTADMWAPREFKTGSLKLKTVTPCGFRSAAGARLASRLRPVQSALSWNPIKRCVRWLLSRQQTRRSSILCRRSFAPAPNPVCPDFRVMKVTSVRPIKCRGCGENRAPENRTVIRRSGRIAPPRGSEPVDFSCRLRVLLGGARILP